MVELYIDTNASLLKTNIELKKYLTDMPVTIEALNASIDLIQGHLNSLNRSKLLKNLCLIQWSVPVYPGDVNGLGAVKKGDLVYYAAGALGGVYKKALAALLDMPGINGQTLETPSSIVLGIIISDPTIDGYAALLRSGYYLDSFIKDTLDDTSTGIYYLSSTELGKASKSPGWSLRQPCLSYYGDNKFAFISHYLAHDSHHHLSFIVPSEGTLLSGNTYSYTLKATDSLYNRLNKNTCTVFYKSVLDINNKVSFLGNTIRWVALDFIEGDVIIFTHQAFSYGSPIVRDISSKTLDIDSSSGSYIILMKAWLKALQTPLFLTDSNVVCAISLNKILTRSVVTGLNAGTNISISKDAKGTHTINAISNVKENTHLEMSDIALNGVQRVTKGIFTYSTFPAGILTNIVASTYFYYPIQQNTFTTVKLALHLIYGDSDCLFNPLIKIYYITTNTDLNQKQLVFSWNGTLQSVERFLSLTEISIGDINISLNGFFICLISGNPTTPFNLLKTSFIIKSITSSLSTV